MLAVGAGLERAGDQHDAGAHQRERDEDPPLDPLAQQRPRGERDDHHLQVAEHRRQPGADILDRVVPEDQVAREEHAGGGGEPAVAAVRGPKRRSSHSASAPSTGTAYAQRKIAAVEGDDVGELDQDRRERDRQRARDGGEAGPLHDPRRPRDRLELREPRLRTRGHSGSAMQAVPTRSNPSRP